MGASVKTISIIVAANIKGLEVGLGKANKSLAKFASGAARMGSLLSFGVTAPLTALGKSAFDTFAKFENGMMKVNTVTGATVGEFKMLTDEAKRLGATTQFTALQVADLQLVLGRKGFDPTAIKNMEKSILDLALATGEDLSLAAEVTASSINAFKLESSDAARVANTLASASANSSIQLSTFSTAFGHAGASANAVGVELEELSAMMGVLMDNGIKASKAGTGLRKIFSKLHKEGRSFTEVLDLATQGELGLEKAMKIAGLTAGGQLLILAKNKDKVAELTEEYKTNTTRLDEMAEAMGGTTLAKVKKMESAIEGLKIEFGALISDAILPIINKITILAQKFSNLEDSTKRTIIKISAFAAAIGPALLIISAIVSVIGVLATKAALVIGAVAVGIYLIINIINGFVRIFAAVGRHIADNIEAIAERFSNFTSKVKNFFIKAFTEAVKFIDKYAQKVGIDWFKQDGDPVFDEIIPDDELKKFTSWSDTVEKSEKKVDDLTQSLKDWIALKLGFGGFGASSSEQQEEEGFDFVGVDDALDEIQALEDELDEEEIEIKVPFKFPSMQEIKNKVSDISSLIGDFAEKWGAQITMAFDVIGKALDNQMVKIENNHKREAALIEASSMTEKAKSDAMIALEKKTAEEKAKIQRKQAIAEKMSAIASAIMNTATAVTKTLGELGFLGIPMSSIVAGLGAVQVATIAAQPIPQFADGGVVSGPTLGLMGEYSGARSNPEVIAPLDRLKSIIGDSGGSNTVIPDVKIKGDDLLIVFDRANRRKSRR